MSPYVEEPDIPEGMTIHEYKLARDIAAGRRGLALLAVAVGALSAGLSVLAQVL